MKTKRVHLALLLAPALWLASFVPAVAQTAVAQTAVAQTAVAQTTSAQAYVESDKGYWQVHTDPKVGGSPKDYGVRLWDPDQRRRPPPPAK